jgi:hypothetical protein
MSIIAFIIIVAMVVIAKRFTHYSRRRPKVLVRRSSFDSKASPRNAFLEECRRKKEKRRDHFIQLGLRPLFIALWISLLVYMLSMVAAVLYYWQQVQLLGWLGMPVLLIVFWSGSFIYARSQFSTKAFVTGLSLLLDYRHLMSDDFWLVGSLARVMVVMFALIIYAKLKDPVFSNISKTSDAA